MSFDESNMNEEKTYPSFCLNCKAQLSGDAMYCDSICRIAFAHKQIREFNKNYKPILDYYPVHFTEIDKNEL